MTDNDWRNFWFAVFLVCLMFLTLFAGITASHARDGGQWQGSPAISKWFGELMQPDNVMVSCCGEADAYEADDFVTDGDHVVAIITDERVVEGRPKWLYGRSRVAGKACHRATCRET